MTPERIGRAELWHSDCRDVLAALPPACVHAIVTSPPYYGLRDYGVAGQLGLEPSPAAYVEAMVAVFREARRVLRDDGCLMLNVGDSYAANRSYQVSKTKHPAHDFGKAGSARCPHGIKPKDLLGIPWRLAFALQDDGWWLRNDIIWSKPNPMPESVTDRCTRAHEYVFHLTKSARYFWDAEAIAEAQTMKPQRRLTPRSANGEAKFSGMPAHRRPPGGEGGGTRNARTVWAINTEPTSEAHFATMPSELARRCIAATTSERGCCPGCGAPWARVVERTTVRPMDYHGKNAAMPPQHSARRMLANVRARRAAGMPHDNPFPRPNHLGWAPSCPCPPADPIACTVLDPFAGFGTTLLAAEQLGRASVGIELSAAYVTMAARRIAAARCRTPAATMADAARLEPTPLEALLSPPKADHHDFS